MTSEKHGFREHGVMLFLSNPLYLGFIKLQADKGLGRSYAGLLPFVEGLYRMGYLSKEDYEIYFKKYSQGLTKKTEKNNESYAEIQEKTELEKLEQHHKLT